MSKPHLLRTLLPLLFIFSHEQALADVVANDIVIEFDSPAIEGDTGGSQIIVIDAVPEPAGANDEVLIIDPPSPSIEFVPDRQAVHAPDESVPSSSSSGTDQVRFSIDDARGEFGVFTRGASAADRSAYGKVAASASWQPDQAWEVRLAGRIDGFHEHGEAGFTHINSDYGDSYVRYRGESWRLTLGTQTVIWGRLDEVPLSDRVSTVDLTRLVLDDIEDRRRANPMLRAEAFFGDGKLDLAWLIDFRAAELPQQDSAWYPVDQRAGRLFGIDRSDVPVALIQNATIVEHEPNGDGGFGIRYTHSHSKADLGLTAARTRQSIPYFRLTPGGELRTEHPRSWMYGVDAAVNAFDATWRVELTYLSDTPVTRTDSRYTTVPSLAWGAGMEFHPGDGDTRVNLQVIGTKLIDAPRVLDRRETYSVNGQIEIPFDRERWRTKLAFSVGLGEKDIYINPEVAFLGWEPHEIYLSAHYFDGAEQTMGGFYEDRDTIQLGWRSRF